MKYRSWLLLAVLVFVSVILGALLRRGGHPIYYGYVVIILLFMATYLHSLIYEFFLVFVEKTYSSRILYVGRGVSLRFQVSYAGVLQTLSYLILVFITIGILYYFAYGHTPAWLVVIAFLMAIVFVVVFTIPSVQAVFTVSTRKTSTEIELPFMLYYFRVFGASHLTLYDILRLIENSIVLKAWAREIKIAFKFASVSGSALISALNTIAENHPSRLVSDIFKRLLTVAISTGSIKEVAGKVFSQIYGQLETRLMTLTEKITMINGGLIFVYVFVPTIFAVVVPLYGGNVAMALVAPLGLFVSFFLLMYAVVSGIMPSAFEVSVPVSLKALASVCLAIVLGSALFAGAHFILHGSSEDVVMLNLIVIPLLIVLPGVVYSELWLRRARLYDRLIKLCLDAATISTSLGENFVTVLDRIAPRYGRDVEDLARKIVMAQTSDELKRKLISNAPTLFHAAFIEVLFQVLALGAKPEMMHEIMATYEQLVGSYGKLKSVSRMQELMILSLSAALGWFVGYLRSTLTGILLNTAAIGETGAWLPTTMMFIKFDPTLYDVLHAVSIMALLFMSGIIGKMRGGSPVFGLRTLLLMLILYNTGLMLARRLVIIGP